MYSCSTDRLRQDKLHRVGNNDRSRVGCLKEQFTIGRAIFYLFLKKRSRKRAATRAHAVKWPVGEGLKGRVTRAIKVAQSVIEVW